MSAATSRQRRRGDGSGGGRSSGSDAVYKSRRDRLEALEGLADSARKLRLTDDDDNEDSMEGFSSGGGGGGGGGPGGGKRPKSSYAYSGSYGAAAGGRQRRSKDRISAAQRRFSAMSQASTRSEMSVSSAASDMAVAPRGHDDPAQAAAGGGRRSRAGGSKAGGPQHPRSALDRRAGRTKGRGGAAAAGRGWADGPSPSPGRGVLLDDASFSSAHSVSSMKTVKVGNRAPAPAFPAGGLASQDEYLDSSHSAKTITMDNKRSRPRQKFEVVPPQAGPAVGSMVGSNGRSLDRSSARSMGSADSASSEGSGASGSRGEEKGSKAGRRKGRDKKDKLSSSASSHSDDDGGVVNSEEGQVSSSGVPQLADEDGMDFEALEDRDHFFGGEGSGGGGTADDYPGGDPHFDGAMGGGPESVSSEDRTAFLCRGLADSVQSLVTALYSLEDGNKGFPPSVSAAILDHTDSIDLAINRIKPVVASIDAGELGGGESGGDDGGGGGSDDQHMEAVSESIGTYLGRIGRLVDMLTETLSKAGRSRVWTAGSEACYVTILELLQRSCLELRHFYDSECGSDGDDSETSGGGEPLLPGISPDRWELGHKVTRAWVAAGQEDKLRALGVDAEKIAAAVDSSSAATSSTSSMSGSGSGSGGGGTPSSSSSPAVDEHGFPLHSGGSGESIASTGSNASLGGSSAAIEVEPEAFRAAALEVLLGNLEWSGSHSIDDVREAFSLLEEGGSGEMGAGAMEDGGADYSSSSGGRKSRNSSSRSKSFDGEGSSAELLAVAEEEEGESEYSATTATTAATAATAPLTDREDEQQHRADKEANKPSRSSRSDRKRGSQRRTSDSSAVSQPQEEVSEPSSPAVAGGTQVAVSAEVPHAALHVLGRIRGAPLPRRSIVDAAAKKLLSEAAHPVSSSSRSVGSVGFEEDCLTVITSEPFGGYDNADGGGGGINSASSSSKTKNRPDSSSSSLLGMEGVGKTTVAALVASREDVRRRFSGGIVWLDVGRRFGHGGDCDSPCRRRDAAAAAPTDPSSSYAHGGEEPMTYAEYRSYLESMCRQLGVLPEDMPRFDADVEEDLASSSSSSPACSLTSPPQRLPDEPSPAERRKAEHRAMKTARRRASAVFRDRGGGDVLIVLDDVAAEEDLRWFSFASSSSSSSSHGGGGDGDHEKSFRAPRLLVTTRNRKIGKSLGGSSASTSAAAGGGGRVDVGPLGSDEALDLLLNESEEGAGAAGAADDNMTEKTAEAAASVVRRCGRHPLAVRAAGQWCRLKKAAVGMDTAAEEVGEEVEKCWERAAASAATWGWSANSQQQHRGGGGARDRGRGSHHHYAGAGAGAGEGGGAENIIVYEILGRVLSPLMGGKETSVIKLCFAALARVFTSWVPCIPLDLAMALWEGVLLAEGEGGDGGGDNERDSVNGADIGDGSVSTASALQEAESFVRMSAKQRRGQIRLIAEAMSSLGAVQLSAKRSDSWDGDGGGGGADADAATEKFLEMHHGIVQEYGEFLCTKQGGLAEGLIRDCERRWNRAFVTSFLSLKGGRGWDDLGMSADCQDYALNMIASHMIRAEMYAEARDLLTDDEFAKGRLALLGCEAGTRRHVRDSEELCRRMRASASAAADANGMGGASGSAPAGGGIESRKTLAQSYAKFSAIIGAEVQRNQGANDAESSLTACHALDRIGLSFVRNKCWREAIGLYEATVKFLKSAGHDDSELVAVMLFSVGTAYFELDEYESSFKAYGNCVKVREKTLGENNATFLRTLHRMGDALAESWKLEPALQCYDKAILAMRLNPSMERKMMGNVLMSKGRVKLKRGELQEAKQCGEESLRGKRAELGSSHEALCREYAFLSDVCVESGDLEEAKRHLDEAIRLMKRSRAVAATAAAETAEGGDILLFKGSRHRLNGEYDDCLMYYSKALEYVKSAQGCRKGEVADMSHLVAVAHMMKGDDVAAIKCFEDSLRSRRTRSRKSDLDVARTLFDMTLCHERLENYDKALKCIDESLSIRKHQLGDCEMTMLTLTEMGTVHTSMKEYEKAGARYDEAFRLCSELLGTDHEHCAAILHEQGVLKSETSGKDEAMKFFDKSLEVRRQRLGADHPSVGETLHMMGSVLIGQNNKHETAEYCLQEALRIRKACFGDDDQRVAETLHMLGTLQEQIGKSDSAIQLLNDALRIRRLGSNQKNIARALNELGTVYRLKQQYDLAIECFEESLGIFLQDLGNNNESILSAYIALGDSEAALGRSRGACTHYEQALDIMMQMPSNTPERIPRLLQKIGMLEHKVGEMDKAKGHLLGYILLWKESGIDDDIDYVNALHIVGTIHKTNGEVAKAHDCWAEAYQTYHDKGLAAKNPHLGGELRRLLQEMARESGTFKNSIFSKFQQGLSDEAA